MDNFTDRANEIVKEGVYKTLVKQREENAEAPAQAAQGQDPALKAMGLKPEDVGAMDVAQKLATKPGKFNLPIIGAQAKMNSAYGTLIKKIAGKITKIASAIK